MTGDEKAAAVEKSQLVAVEKSQQLKEEKPNAAPTEWELFNIESDFEFSVIFLVFNDNVLSGKFSHTDSDLDGHSN